MTNDFEPNNTENGARDDPQDNFMRFFRFSSAVDTVNKNLQKYKNDKLAPIGLRSMHLMYLCCLDKSPIGLTLTELAKVCGVDKAFISRVTRELSAFGYVAYATPDIIPPQIYPKYKKQLVLTEKGKLVMKKINEMIDKAVTVITGNISPEDFEVFYSVLDKLSANLAEISD